MAIYTLVAGKLRQDAAPTRRGLFSIAGESMNTVIQAKMQGELTQLFLLARYANAKFLLAGIPQDYPLAEDSMSFDARVMRGLYDEGYRGGRDGATWRSTPPGLDIEHLAAARSDTRFVTARESSASRQWTPENPRITVDNHPSQ
jgi:hypothetical protein